MSVAHDRRRRALAAAPAPGQDEAVLLAAALSLALRDVLPEALAGAQQQPGCVRCVRKRKTAEGGGGVLPDVEQAITWLPDAGPVCYGCFG